MAKRIHFLVLVACLVGVATLGWAQSGRQSQNGTITIRVACHCQLVSAEKQNQPLHFTAMGNLWRNTKHLRIASNCAWNLRVVTNKRNNDWDDDRDRDDCKDKNKNKDKNESDCNDKGNTSYRITYTIRNVKGKGKLLNPNEKYVLGAISSNLPSGIGELEFDVVFELEGKDLKKMKCGQDNTWVGFNVLPKE